MKKHLAIIAAAFYVAGCGVYECIDAKIPRTPIPMEPISVEIAYSGAPVVQREIHCERYYDALCAERGNYWSVRQVGMKSQHDISWVSIQDPRIGEIRLDLPLCNYVHQGRVTTLKWVHPMINGEHYSYVKSAGRIHIYRTWSKGSWKPIELEFDYKINGVSLAATQG